MSYSRSAAALTGYRSGLAPSADRRGFEFIRDYLADLTSQSDAKAEVEELRRLSLDGQGHSQGWKFNREEIHERS